MAGYDDGWMRERANHHLFAPQMASDSIGSSESTYQHSPFVGILILAGSQTYQL